MIGVKRPVRIGDKWELDEESVDIRSILPEFSPDEEIKYGPMQHRVAKLAELRSVRGIDCLQINAEWISENPLMASFPEGGKIAKSDGRLTYSGLFPVDPSLRCLRSERNLEWSVDIELTNGIVKGAIVRQTLIEKLTKEVTRP